MSVSKLIANTVSRCIQLCKVSNFQYQRKGRGHAGRQERNEGESSRMWKEPSIEHSLLIILNGLNPWGRGSCLWWPEDKGKLWQRCKSVSGTRVSPCARTTAAVSMGVPKWVRTSTKQTCEDVLEGQGIKQHVTFQIFRDYGASVETSERFSDGVIIAPIVVAAFHVTDNEDISDVQTSQVPHPKVAKATQARNVVRQFV